MVDSVHREETRELKAILFADVAGYSRLMQDDEAGTHADMSVLISCFRKGSDKYRGDILEIRGDGMFALFASVSDAVRFALAFQKTAVDYCRDHDEHRKVRFRIGIHTGDIVRDGNMYYGDAVNVAARIEGAAAPGHVYISRLAYEHVKNTGQFGFHNLGFRKLKHLRVPVEVFRVTGDSASATRIASHRAPLVDMPFTLESEDRMSRPSVAILPLKNLNRETRFDYFADGVTEDIITNLYRFQNLFVIARSSTFSYKNKELSSKRIGQELNVRYLADGSIRVVDNRVRISVQLIDTHRDQVLWAEQYDRSLDYIFEVQDEISAIIANAISVEISNEERAWANRVLPSEMNAYHSLLRGQQHLYRYTKEDLRTAKRFYEQAVAQDPRYGRALAAIAYTMNYEWLFSWTDNSDQALDHALSIAREAADLDPGDARAHASIGLVSLYQKKHDASIDHYNRALELNPNDADILVDLADCYCHSGEFEKSVRYNQKAMRLNPFYPDYYLWNLGGTYYALGRYQDAVDAVNHMNNKTEGSRILAAGYAQLGDFDNAKLYAQRVLEAHPDFKLDKWLQMMPDKYPEHGEHFIEGLRKAGLH